MNVVERAQAVWLAKRGHRVELITRRADPEQPDLMELEPGVFLRHLDGGPRTPLPKSVIDSHIPEFASGLAQLRDFDLVHSNHWMSGVAALPWARHEGIPHVQSYHSVAALPNSPLSDGEPPESEARVAGEAFCARESDAIVAISAAEAHTAIERCGADPGKVHIVWPGVDHALFTPEGAIEQVRPYLLFAARLQPLKGPELVIRALAQVPQVIRPRLLIAGDVSEDFAPYEAQLHELVDELGLTGMVEFIGPQPRDQLAELMRSATLMLVPSHSETFGLVALEAAASGTPVVAASAGGLREAVVHLETGHLLDSREPEDWGRAITMLLSDPVRLTMMGIVSRVHALRFEWRAAAAKLESLYYYLIDG
jgi:D-inositol-3-phosphate glycosyltransferase